MEVQDYEFEFLLLIFLVIFSFSSSQVTANLVTAKLGVSSSSILSAPVDDTLQLEGARVTLIEANHCPGAVLFLFRLTNGCAYLHTGDFRADEEMLRHPALQQFVAADCRKR